MKIITDPPPDDSGSSGRRPPKGSGGAPGGPAPSEMRSIMNGAVIFAIGTLSSRILGLLRDMMTARYFSNDVRDAFLAAFRLPNLFRRLFGEGALSISFIPVFVEVLAGRGEEDKSAVERRARRLVSGVFAILLAITITISGLATLFMEDILRVLLSGEAYMSVPGKFELTVRLARIMFSFLILISLYAYFMAILNGLKKFALAALAPCLFNVSMIGAARLSPTLAAPEFALAWAVILGGLLQMAVLIPAVWREGLLPRPTLKIMTPDVARVLKAMGPAIFGTSIFQMTALVNMYFASRLPSGSQSYLYLADRILELPLSLFVVSMGAALLPTLSRLHVAGDKEAMGQALNHAVRVVLFVSLPAALGMLVLAHPITEVLFMGREFKYQDALATAQVIQVYSAGLVFVAGVRIFAQGFYAIQNTWYPAVAGLVALFSHVMFALALTRHFGLPGLAGASVASALVNFLMLFVAYDSWVGSIRMRALAKSFATYLICGGAMVLSLQIYGVIVKYFGGRLFKRSAVLVITISLGIAVYFLMAHLLRVPEARHVIGLVRAKLKKSGGTSAPEPDPGA